MSADALEPMETPTPLQTCSKHNRCPDCTNDYIPDGQRRCNGTSHQTTHRCGRAATPGAYVCASHGGKSPQVRAKAQLRLVELIDPAIATLAREMAQAKSSIDRQRAANSILDRAGVARRTEVDHGGARQLLVERLQAVLAARDVVQGEAEDVTDALEA